MLQTTKMQELLHAASQRREPLPAVEAVRICDAAGDGLPGVVVDRFGAVAVVRLHEGPYGVSTSTGAAVAEALKALPWCEAALIWRNAGDAAETTRGGAECVFGTVAEEFVIREHGCSYIVRPFATPSAGLFIDMRDVRARLLKVSTGKRVLNTFCFTGSLGVAAWRGGASEVVQVDISKSVLTWARRNAELQDVGGMGEIRYIPEDTGTFLTREVKRIEKGKPRYDVVIIDPPVFGSSKGVRFVQERELPHLVKLGLLVLASHGELYLSSNRSAVTAEVLWEIIKEAAAEVGRSISEQVVLLPPSVDFTFRGELSSSMRGVRVTLA